MAQNQKKPGRPKLKPSDAKGVTLRVRMTEGLRDDLEELAEEAGVTASEFVRRLISREQRKRAAIRISPDYDGQRRCLHKMTSQKR